MHLGKRISQNEVSRWALNDTKGTQGKPKPAGAEGEWKREHKQLYTRLDEP